MILLIIQKNTNLIKRSGGTGPVKLQQPTLCKVLNPVGKSLQMRGRLSIMKPSFLLKRRLFILGKLTEFSRKEERYIWDYYKNYKHGC